MGWFSVGSGVDGWGEVWRPGRVSTGPRGTRDRSSVPQNRSLGCGRSTARMSRAVGVRVAFTRARNAGDELEVRVFARVPETSQPEIHRRKLSVLCIRHRGENRDAGRDRRRSRRVWRACFAEVALTEEVSAGEVRWTEFDGTAKECWTGEKLVVASAHARDLAEREQWRAARPQQAERRRVAASAAERG